MIFFAEQTDGCTTTLTDPIFRPRALVGTAQRWPEETKLDQSHKILIFMRFVKARSLHFFN
jgi:hypothetical protein